MLPDEHAQATVEDELESARAWGERHQVPITWKPEALELRAVLVQPSTGSEFYLRGRFDNYRELPPEWAFCSPDWRKRGKQYFPARPSRTPFGSPILHSNGLICAHFNRLAYKSHGGPHADWGGPAQWITSDDRYAYADVIGDMLQVIKRDFDHSTGRMG